MRLVSFVHASLPVVMILAACGSGDQSSAETGAPPSGQVDAEYQIEEILVWRCPQGFQAMTRIDAGLVTLTFPSSEETLPRVVSASGAKYQSGAFVFWNQGEEALIEAEGESYFSCTIIGTGTPPSSDSTFRAQGNEPGWLLDLIEQGPLHLEMFYGDAVIDAETPERDAGAALTYSLNADGHSVEIRLTEEVCRDGMSGFPFPWSARLTFDGTAYPGCGYSIP